jgi:hypothetical protein
MELEIDGKYSFIRELELTKLASLIVKTGPRAKPTANEAAPGSTRSTRPTTPRPKTRWQRTRTSVSRPLLTRRASSDPTAIERTLSTFNKRLTRTAKQAWLSVEITYGLYLSDHSILDAVDTELVVLGGIMMQDLPRETGWHLRGTRRIGGVF